MVTPVPVMNPLVQVTGPLRVSVPAPVSVPPEKVKVLLICDVAAMESVASDDRLSAESLVRLLMVCVPDETVTETPDPMQTLSAGPGRTLPLQLVAVCQRPLPAVPVQLIVQPA